MKIGCVRWFNNLKGYGFIKTRDNENIFVHYSSIKLDGYKTLASNQIVEFKLINTVKGKQAIDVKLIKDSEPIKQ